jgi:hypothetical protein
MNPNLPVQNHNPYPIQKLDCERAKALRDEEWQLHNECVALAREALELYKTQGEKRLRLPDLARLIDLASRLGHLATGTPAEHIQHAWQQREYPPWWSQLEADIERIYGKAEEDLK